MKHGQVSRGNIAAMILAGGKGTRLQTVVGDRPKVLAQVTGRPFISYLLDLLIVNGFHRVVLCTGYMAELVQKTFGATYNGMEIQYSRETIPLGTGGAIGHALPLLEADWVLAMNGDSYIDVDLDAYLEWHFARGSRASLVLTLVPDAARYGFVELGEEDRITRFHEKTGQHAPGWINAGIYLIQKSTLEAIPDRTFLSLEKELLPELSREGLYGYRCRGKFIDIGTPQSFAEAQTFFK